MIGGCDVTIASSETIEDLVYLAAQVILEVWPNGVIESADVENKIIHLPDLFGAKEAFVYKDLASQKSWAENGWTKENCKSMIHLLASVEDGLITCVVEDQKDPVLLCILEAIKNGIQT